MDMEFMQNVVLGNVLSVMLLESRAVYFLIFRHVSVTCWLQDCYLCSIKSSRPNLSLIYVVVIVTYQS